MGMDQLEFNSENLMQQIELVTNKDQASQVKRGYIKYLEYVNNISKTEATELANNNLGYLFGYYSEEQRSRFEDIFDCVHPIFGSVRDHKWAVEELFLKGVEMAIKI